MIMSHCDSTQNLTMYHQNTDRFLKFNFSSFETKDSCELVKEYVYTALVSKCRPRSMTIHDTPSTRRHSFPPDKRARAWTASNSTDIHRKQLGKEKVRCGFVARNFGFQNLEQGISVKHFYFSRLKMVQKRNSRLECT